MKRKGLFAAAVVSALCAPSANADGYVVTSVTRTDFSAFGGSTAEAYDINNHGQFVGVSTNGAGLRRGFLYDGGAMIDVTATMGRGQSAANGINNNGTVVGFFLDSSGAIHAYRWDSGVVTPLAEASRPPYSVTSSAVAIGDNDHIVGRMSYSTLREGNYEVATMWTDPTTFFSLDPTLEVFRFWSHATDVDALGRATGINLEFNRAMLWKPFALPNEQIPAPPPLAGYRNFSTDVLGVHHEAGVVGTSFFWPLSGDFAIGRAIYWDESSATSKFLGTLPGGQQSGATDINRQRFITGWSHQPTPGGGGRVAAFLFHKNLGMYALPLDKGTSCEGLALNDRQQNGLIQVVGFCQSGFITRAARWDVMVEWVP